METTIDTGDHVRHQPTGEEWVVAYVKGNRLAWCGWPPGEAILSDCVLLEKATESKRSELLRTMAECGDDERCAYARQRLDRIETHGDCDTVLAKADPVRDELWEILCSMVDDPDDDAEVSTALAKLRKAAQDD